MSLQRTITKRDDKIRYAYINVYQWETWKAGATDRGGGGAATGFRTGFPEVDLLIMDAALSLFTACEASFQEMDTCRF